MSNKKHIEECVRESLEGYFRDLRGVEPTAMYEMILRVVERPLLDVVLKHAEGNQSKAAEWLGINRNTLRRKLLEHRLGDPLPPPAAASLGAGRHLLVRRQGSPPGRRPAIQCKLTPAGPPVAAF